MSEHAGIASRSSLPTTLLMSLGLLLVAPTWAYAAELRKTENENCAWRIDGPLNGGDVDRIKSVLGSASNMQTEQSKESPSIKFSYFGTRTGVVCLNISDGSLAEGLSLMRFFRDSRWGTFIGEGDVCLSVCGFAFMGGTSDFYDGETRLFRTLDVRGRLAFDLANLSSGQDIGAPVQSSPSDANAIVVLIRELSQEISGEKTPYFHIDLILEILSLSKKRTYEIDTVQKAVRYDISLSGYETKKHQAHIYNNICNNLIVRTFGLVQRNDATEATGNQSSFFDEDNYSETIVGLEDGRLVRQVELKTIYELDGSSDICVIGQLQSSFSSSRYDRGSNADVTLFGEGSLGYYRFAPDTPLTELAGDRTAAANKEQSDAIAPEGFQISSFWRHNGSTMALLKGDRDARAFIYAEPRAALREKGVDVGTLLFDGRTPDGTVYEGLARTYSCGTRRHPVSGIVSADSLSIFLKGKSPRLDQSCQIVGEQEDSLVFEFLGLASDPKFAEKLKLPFGNSTRNRSQFLRDMHL